MCFETTRGAVGSPLPAPLVFAVHDPEDPNRVHIVRGSVSGIHALQALLEQRFLDGQEVGRKSASESAEMDVLILRTRIGELETHQREDVAMINHAAESLGLATEVIRRYQVVFRAARDLQARFGAAVESIGEDEEPTDDAAAALHASAQALFQALDEFKIPKRGK